MASENIIDSPENLDEAVRRVGKSPTGTIELSAAQRGNNVVVEISDDGAGIDCEALRAKAVDRQLALCAPDEIDLRFGRKRSIET